MFFVKTLLLLKLFGATIYIEPVGAKVGSKLEIVS